MLVNVVVKHLLLALLLLLNEASSAPTDCHTTDDTSSSNSVSSKISITSLKIEEVEVPLIFSLFASITILAKLGWHHPWMHLISSNIPESCMLIVVGAHIGGMLVAYFNLVGSTFPFRFTPEILFVYLLPPIVFAAGYFVDATTFMRNLMSILTFAYIGTIWNAFALGFAIYGLSKARLMQSVFSLSSAVLFGAICSSVDPVAVLAIFDEIQVNKLLHILVFGESLLNDAVSVVLFQVLSAFANIPFDVNRNQNPHNIGVDIVIGILQFFVVNIVSLIIGTVMGLLGSALSKYTLTIPEPIVVILTGYLAYLFADLFALSGIVSLVVCSLILQYYIPANFTWKSNITTKYCLKMFSLLAEMIIFFFLGVSLYDVDIHHIDIGLILWTIFLAVIIRPIGIIALSLLLNLCRVRKINTKQIFIMSYSGLRGGISFSLALARLSETGAKYLPKEEITLRKNMLTATTALVIFTVFFQGVTIKPLVNLIGVKKRKLENKSFAVNNILHETTTEHITSGVEDIAGQFGFVKISNILNCINEKFLQKNIERFPNAKNNEILYEFNMLQHSELQQALRQSNIDKSKDEMKTMVKSGDRLREDYAPALDELLLASHSHPHADHYMHVMHKEQLENQELNLREINTNQRLMKRTRSEKMFRRQTTTLAEFRYQPLDEVSEQEESD